MQFSKLQSFRYVFICILGVSLIQVSAAIAKRRQQTSYKKSVALVIGVSQYTNGWPPLTESGNDAQTIANTLSENGFDVMLLLNEAATKSSILKQLQTELPSKLNKDTRFLFYFSGHGQTYMTPSGVKQGFIVPYDGKQSRGQDALHTYISMSELKEIFTAYLPSKHNAVIFDSCFSGLMLSRGLKMKKPSRSNHLELGVNVLSAGAQNEVAADGLFTPTLVEGLRGKADRNRDGMITFSELSIYTQTKVQQSNPRQTPQFGSLIGEGQTVFDVRSKSKGSLRTLGSLKPQPKHRPTSVFVESNPQSMFIESAVSDAVDIRSTRRSECGVLSHASRALKLAQFLGKKKCGDMQDRFEVDRYGVKDKFLKIRWHKLTFEKLSYEDAEESCLNQGPDRRLPTLNELASLVTSTRQSGGYMPLRINNLRNVWLWAKSPLDDEGLQSSIDFSNGQVYFEYFNNLRAYVCVTQF